MGNYLFHHLQPQDKPGGVKQMFASQAEKPHARVLSDDIKFNTANLHKQAFPAAIGGTQIHTN